MSKKNNNIAQSKKKEQIKIKKIIVIKYTMTGRVKKIPQKRSF